MLTVSIRCPPGCKLLLGLPASTPNSGRWLEHAIKYFKNDPIVLKLRQHLRDAGGDQTSASGEDVDKLLAGEAAVDGLLRSSNDP